MWRSWAHIWRISVVSKRMLSEWWTLIISLLQETSLSRTTSYSSRTYSCVTRISALCRDRTWSALLTWSAPVSQRHQMLPITACLLCSNYLSPISYETSCRLHSVIVRDKESENMPDLHVIVKRIKSNNLLAEIDSPLTNRSICYKSFWATSCWIRRYREDNWAELHYTRY